MPIFPTTFWRSFEAILTQPRRILGIDPGSRLTGFGVLDFVGDKPTLRGQWHGEEPRRHVSGAAQGKFSKRSARSWREYRPDIVAIESVFMHKNAGSALKLGHARSAALCATFAFEVEVLEYAPREIKQAIVGTGCGDARSRCSTWCIACCNSTDSRRRMRPMRWRRRLCHGHQRASAGALAAGRHRGRAMIGSLRGRLAAKQAPRHRH